MSPQITDLARSNLRANKRGLAGVFVAVLCAAALITGLGLIVESGVRGGVEPQRYAGVDAVVTAPKSLPVKEDLDPALPERAALSQDQVAAVAALPEVSSAVGDVTVPLVVDGAPVEGHGWSSAAATGTALASGHAPETDAQVVVDRRVGSLGDRLTLLTPDGPSEVTVTGTVEPAGPRAPHLYLVDAQARALAPHDGAATAILVSAEDGVDDGTLADAISASVPKVDVDTGRARGDAEFAEAGAARSVLVQIGIAFASLALMVALFVVAGTLALLVGQRRREFALLRSVGATPGQIHRLLGRETYLVAGVAALIGVVPGFALAVLLRRLFVDADTLPADFDLAVSPLSPLVAVVLCLLTARLAAWIAARRPARIDPVEALGEADSGAKELGAWRIRGGLILLALGLSAAMTPLFVGGQVAAAGAGGATLVLMIGVAMLGPRIVSAVMHVVGPPMVATGRPALVLATASATHNSRRLSSAVTPLALAIGLGCVQVFAATTLSAEAGSQARAGVLADSVVSGPGAGVTAAQVEAIVRTPGVEAANAITRSAAFVETGSGETAQTQPFAVQGVDPAGVGATLDLAIASGDVGRLEGRDTVALSTDAAQAMGVGLGDRVRITLGDGADIRSRVVATYDRGLGFGDITIANAVLRPHTTAGLSSHVLVRTAPGRTGAVTAVLAEAGFEVGDRAQLDAAGKQDRDTQSWTSLIALAILLGYLAVAVVNTLVLATLDRVREFALLRLVGARARQVREQMRTESVLVVAISLVVGTLIALPPLVGVAFGLTGSPVPAIDLPTYGVLAGATLLIGVLAIAVPTRRALRQPAIRAGGSRE